MLLNNVALLMVYRWVEPSAGTLWDCISAIPNGMAFDFDSVPSSTIGTEIVNLVHSSVIRISRLTLVAEPGYEAWLTRVTPRNTGI